MRDAQQFNFIEGFDTFGVPDALPQLPLSLSYRGTAVEVVALLDTGASVNVLPYSVGIQGGLTVAAIALPTQKRSLLEFVRVDWLNT
jgi:hypothetical protein